MINHVISYYAINKYVIIMLKKSIKRSNLFFHIPCAAMKATKCEGWGEPSPI